MRAFAATLLATMAAGLVANALASWKNQGVLETRVYQVEKTQEKQDNTNKELHGKIDDLHWYMIQSRGIVVPPKENR